MGALKRHPTQYKGVFYREVERIGLKGIERMYYIVFKKEGKLYEEKVGGQYRDNMTPARAHRVRAAKIEGYEATKRAIKAEQAKTIWTIDRLWYEYIGPKPATKSFQTDRYRYQKYLQSPLGKKEPEDISQIELHRLKITLAKTLSAKTVKNILELLERIVNFGVKKGLCQGLNFKIEMPKLNN